MPANNIGLTIFLITVTAFILLLMGFIITILFLHQKRLRTHLSQLEAIRIEHEKGLFKAKLEMQEQTFQVIAREIHDNIGQFLSLAKLNLNTLNFEDKISVSDAVGNSVDLLTKALDDLRDLSRSLSCDIIRSGGLKKAIEMQVDQLQRTGIYKIVFDIKGNYQYLSEHTEIILFRILQEAINNIIRHSNASEIIILLLALKEKVKLYIQDNGKGFDVEQFALLEARNIGGLNNMQKRAKLINAELEIESFFGKGTKITVTTPL